MAAVGGGDRADDGEAEAGATVGAGAVGVEAAEGVEQGGDLVLGDRGTAVGDPDDGQGGRARPVSTSTQSPGWLWRTALSTRLATRRSSRARSSATGARPRTELTRRPRRSVSPAGRRPGGVLLGATVTAMYALGRGWSVVVPTPAMAGGLLAALAIGAVGRLCPALRAARLAPTDALRTV